MTQVLAGKKRKINARFEAMTGHYLFKPEFCNVASGWEPHVSDWLPLHRDCG